MQPQRGHIASNGGAIPTPYNTSTDEATARVPPGQLNRGSWGGPQFSQQGGPSSGFPSPSASFYGHDSQRPPSPGRPSMAQMPAMGPPSFDPRLSGHLPPGAMTGPPVFDMPGGGRAPSPGRRQSGTNTGGFDPRMSGGGPPPPMRMSGGGMQPQMRMSNGGMQPQMRMSGGGMQPAPHGGGYPGSSGSPCGGQSQEAESPTYRQPSSPGGAPLFYIPRKNTMHTGPMQPDSPMSPGYDGGSPSFSSGSPYGLHSGPRTGPFSQHHPGAYVLDSNERAPGGAFPDVPLRPLTLDSTGAMGLGAGPQVMIQMQEVMAMQQGVPGDMTGEFRIRAFTTMQEGTARTAVKPFDEDLLGKRPLQEEEQLAKRDNLRERVPFNARRDLVPVEANYLGLLLFFAFSASTVYYFYIRATRTMDIGWTWYAGIILATEIFTSTSTFSYAITMLGRTKNRKSMGLAPRKDGGRLPKDTIPYRFDVRVLVPCYKEAIEVVETTLKATLNADLPWNCTRTIYLCDDGNDAVKRELAERMGPEVVYVTGRVRQKGEINGKSNNLNNCLQHLYPKGTTIPNSEVVVVLDADMVPNQSFFLKVLEVMQDEGCALCLTPQGYHNVRPDGDIFNNVNLGFWEYILPGLDALGYIACTGTNFAIRANALGHAGWFPTYTITEDYALGMELKRLGYSSIYLKEYLAYGEAPEEMRNIFRQRSRWCKGQMQIFFSSRCPIFNGGLSISQRLLYTTTCWCYITNMFAVPMAVLVPFMSMVFGVLPFVLNRDFALAATLYLISGALVNLYCRKRWHVKLMWFGTISNHLLWFTYSKAILNVLANKLSMKGKTTFKTTKKKGVDEKVEEAPGCHAPDLSEMEGTKDFYVLCLSMAISLTTASVTVYKLADQGPKPHLLMVLFWALYNSIPPFLFVMYTCYSGKGRVYEDLCTLGFLVVHVAATMGIVGMWLVPSEYDFGQVLGVAMLFYDAQKSGMINVATNNVPWRGDSGLNDTWSEDKPLIGGYYDGGDHIKNSYTIATTVTFLAWSVVEFGKGYEAAKQKQHALDLIKWGSDYLIKCHVEKEKFVAQVGNVSVSRSYWLRPEDMIEERPAFAVDPSNPGTDVVAAAAAALAATSAAFLPINREYAGLCMQESLSLYQFASSYLGPYSKSVPTEGNYYSDSYYDDLAWAAAWINRVSGSQQYLKEAENWYNLYFKLEAKNDAGMVFDYGHIGPGIDLMLAQLTEKTQYVDRLERFINGWMTGSGVMYTPHELAMLPPNGTLQYTANAAMLAVLWGKKRPAQALDNNCWARKQIAYMLGDSGTSYVVGFGNAPTKVPHRAASCPDPGTEICTWQTGYLSSAANPHVLYGALVGGPDKTDTFYDDRSWNSTMNRVSLLNNAGFVSTIAGLKAQGVTEAKCQQGVGLLQEAVKKSSGVKYRRR